MFELYTGEGDVVADLKMLNDVCIPLSLEILALCAQWGLVLRESLICPLGLLFTDVQAEADDRIRIPEDLWVLRRSLSTPPRSVCMCAIGVTINQVAEFPYTFR